ncbi:MAG: hypothetical protein E2602_05845, partial [Achromobacter sp.]|nr:hypothetical protein [Achromobacter sp.]
LSMALVLGLPAMAAASGAAPPATQVQGYALEPRAPTPAQAAPDALWLWLLAVAGLVALGASRPARW